MTDKAIFSADYVDLGFKPGLKVARIVFEIPIEESASFIQAFGTPDRVNPAKCAIARLEIGSGKQADAPAVPAPRTPSDVAQGQSKPRRSNVAAVMIKENKAFQAWLVDTYWTGTEEIGDYDGLLKKALGIKSKSELDTDAGAAERWERLRTSFDYTGMVR